MPYANFLNSFEFDLKSRSVCLQINPVNIVNQIFNTGNTYYDQIDNNLCYDFAMFVSAYGDLSADSIYYDSNNCSFYALSICFDESEFVLCKPQKNFTKCEKSKILNTHQK